MERRNKIRRRIWGRRWLWICLLTLLGAAAGSVHVLRLTEGGYIAFPSMLFACLAGYFYGGHCGLISALLLGALRYVADLGLVWNVPELWDYLLGYGLLAVCGYLSAGAWVAVTRESEEDPMQPELPPDRGGRMPLAAAFAVACLLRYVEGVLNFVVFYDHDIRLSTRLYHAMVYSFVYIGLEGLVTIAILCIPVVMSAIDFVRYVAAHIYDEEYFTL